MLHKTFKPAKCKTSLKLAASRIKLLKNRKDVQIKQLRREVAQLLDSGQVQTARIRVEHVNREEKTMGAYNLIEIYCELIASRLSIIESQKNCPIDLKEAITSVVFASPRCADVPELADVRKHFKAKYGKDFISASVELRPDCGVNRSLVEKLSAKAPDGVTKVKILTAIAEEHNIKWDPNTFGGNDTTSQDDSLQKGPSTFEKASRMHEEPPNVRMPYNPQASPSFDIGSHKVANVEPVKNLNARAAFSGQSVPPSPEHIRTPVNSDLGMFSSGNVGEGYETRRRYSGDSNINCVDRPDWNMEFTDATTAAQVAAESAERASIAARAAAELSILGRVTPRYAPDSHGFKKERSEIPSTPRSPGEAPTRSQVNNASVDRNSGLAYDHFGDERIERPPILRSPGEAPPKIHVNNASVCRSSGAYDHFGDERLKRPPVVLSPGEAPFRSQVNNASVGRSPGLAYDHFRDERLERTPSLCSPGESPPRSWVNNASVSRNSGLAYDNVGKNEENLLHDHKSYNTLGKSSSYKSNPDVGLIFHSGPVTGDGTVVSDAYSNQGDVSEDDDSLSGITKKLHRYAYKKGSEYDEPISGDAVGDVDASVYEQHAAGRYTEMNRWSAGLKNGDISNRRNERKNSFGEVSRTTHSSEIHARRESVEYVESFVRFTPEMKESYGYEKDSSHASTWSQPSRSSSFAEKKDFSSLSNEKAEGGFAENLFDDRDEERISVRSNAAGGSLAVFDDYGSDDDVYVFDLDKGHTSHDSGKTGPEQTSANFLEKSSSAAHYSLENQLFVDVPSSKAASESEEDLPVTSYDSDGPSFENEEAPGKSRAPGKIGDFVDKKLSGSSKFTSVSKAEGADSSSSRPVILADKSEQEMTSDSGKVLPYGNILPGIRNRRRLSPPAAGTMTDKDSWTDQRREGPRFSPSNSTSTDKASNEDPDIHYVEDQVMTRPNRRVQTNFVVSHEMTIPQLNTESRPVMHDYGDEEVELDANYWRKPSTRPTKNYSAEKIRLSSQSSLLSDSGQNSDVAEGRPSQVSPGNSHVGAVTGLSRRAKVGPSSTYHSTSGKPSSDAENSGFSPRSTDRGKNSEKPRVRTNAPDGSKSSGPLTWRSGEPKASSKESPKKTAANNQSSVPTGREDATESSKPAKPILDSTSRENSSRASHVHPKLPDYETFIANLKTLRANRQ